MIDATKFNMDMEKLKGSSIFLATPMYGGQCFGSYANSLARLVNICTTHGVNLQIYFSYNESLIPRARNYCADMFMQSDCTHMMFIDADIGFDPMDVIRLLAIQLAHPKEYNIIGAVYPKKNISWEKIKAAANMFDDPMELANVQSDFVFNFIPGTTGHRIDHVVEAKEIGTGFMMIPRETFTMYKDAFPGYSYIPDHPRSEDFNGDREIMMYFQSAIDETTRRYLSEDYWFCQKIREIGGKVWFCPWMSERLEHTGTHIYKGSLRAIAAAGVSPTVDKKALTKKAKS